MTTIDEIKQYIETKLLHSCYKTPENAKELLAVSEKKVVFVSWCPGFCPARDLPLAIERGAIAHHLAGRKLSYVPEEHYSLAFAATIEKKKIYNHSQIGFKVDHPYFEGKIPIRFDFNKQKKGRLGSKFSVIDDQDFVCMVENFTVPAPEISYLKLDEIKDFFVREYLHCAKGQRPHTDCSERCHKKAMFVLEIGGPDETTKKRISEIHNKLIKLSKSDAKKPIRGSCAQDKKTFEKGVQEPFTLVCDTDVIDSISENIDRMISNVDRTSTFHDPIGRENTVAMEEEFSHFEMRKPVKRRLSFSSDEER